MEILLAAAILISFISAVISAVVVVFRAPREPTRRWLALFLIFGASWSLIVNFQNPSASSDYNLWIIRLTFIAAILMVYTLYRFAASMTQVHLPRYSKMLIPVTTLLILIATLSGLVIGSVATAGNVVIPERLFAYYIVISFIILLASYGIGMIIWKSYHTSNQQMRDRLRIIAIGLTGGIILGSLTNVVLPNILGSIEPARYAWMAIVLWNFVLIYAMIRHHFLDVRLAVVRTVVYFMVLTTMIGLYFGLAFAISLLLPHTVIDTTELAANIGVALALALAFQPIKRFFDKLTNNIFYRDSYSVDDFFARLSRELSQAGDLRTLLLRASKEINNTLKAEHTFFFMRYGNNKHITVGTKHRSFMALADIEKLDEMLIDKQTLIVTDVLDEEDPLYKLLSSHNIAITLPLEHAEGMIGYLFLGYPRSRDYAKRDIRALEAISDELVIAVQNALSVQEVKEINATLQQRIEDATKELRESNAKLQRLDTAKDEFVSMASHQLRTPLTSVKGYISMVLEGDAGKITPAQRQLLEEAFTSSERMVHLINDFLNVSRLQTGRFIIEARRVDLAKVVEQEVESLQTTAHAHNLTLRFHPPTHFPSLYLDEGKIRQVLMNFIDNAIYYSREHTTITIHLAVEDGSAVLTVNDTGIGVPKSEQAHLFTKFFRATNARKQRPDGTGVGLFLAKKVIVAHGGSMVFASTEGRGSTFGFRLPIKPLSTAAHDADKLKKQPDHE